MTTEAKGSGSIPTRESFLNEFIRPVASPLVVEAFSRVDRHNFVPTGYKFSAYTDSIIPICKGSSISQSSLVAKMMSFLGLKGDGIVLEIGTASGYGAALLSHCASQVFTVEYDIRLAKTARQKLERYGYANVEVHAGDGALGMPKKAPFDAIIVTAGVRDIPKALEEQLAENGRIVVPVGKDPWNLKLILGTKNNSILSANKVMDGVYFFPLMSPEHGGWTVEALQHVKEVKIRALQNAMEQQSGKSIGSEKELKEVLAEKLRILPEEVNIDELIRLLQLPDSAFDDPSETNTV